MLASFLCRKRCPLVSSRRGRAGAEPAADETLGTAAVQQEEHGAPRDGARIPPQSIASLIMRPSRFTPRRPLSCRDSTACWRTAPLMSLARRPTSTAGAAPRRPAPQPGPSRLCPRPPPSLFATTTPPHDRKPPKHTLAPPLTHAWPLASQEAAQAHGRAALLPARRVQRHQDLQRHAAFGARQGQQGAPPPPLRAPLPPSPNCVRCLTPLSPGGQARRDAGLLRRRQPRADRVGQRPDQGLEGARPARELRRRGGRGGGGRGGPRGGIREEASVL